MSLRVKVTHGLCVCHEGPAVHMPDPPPPEPLGASNCQIGPEYGWPASWRRNVLLQVHSFAKVLVHFMCVDSC